MKYKSLMPALFFSLLLYVSVFAQSTLSGTITKNANLRAGPATTYAVVGTVKQGQTVTIIGKNDAGTWYHLDSGQWIATFLVKVATTAPQSAPTQANATPQNTSTTPAPTTAPTATPKPAPTNQSIVGIGQELHGKGWRFKVAAIHKRKAVYLYDYSYVAMGHFLVVIVEGTNEQSGTDYFANNIKPYVTNDPGNAYEESWKGSSYAAWQYEGLATSYTDVNPGNFVRIAMAFDLPDNTSHVMLSTALPGWVELGDFAGMKSEDN